MNPGLIWAWTAGAFAVMVPVTLLLSHFNPRLIGGGNAWWKPFRFALSLAIHYATFAVIAYWLPANELSQTWWAGTAYASVAAGICELGYICVQASRGRHSHFNNSTRLEAVASNLMGIGALIVLSPAAVVGLSVAFAPPRSWPLAVTVGTAAGLLLGAALTVFTAARMGAMRSHFATKRPVVDRSMPLTGWSLEGADLRPSHFLATHMMQAIPLVAIIAYEVTSDYALPLTVLATMAWTAVTLGIFRWTVMGRPVASLIECVRNFVCEAL